MAVAASVAAVASGTVLLVLGTRVMIKRDRRGHSYCVVEVKFLDPRKTIYCESICQECFH